MTGVGFSQRIPLEWLEQTANLVLAGNDAASIRAFLEELLADKLSVGSHAKRGNRYKAISILMKIWVRPPRQLKSFWQRGLHLLSRLPVDEHLAVHWGMTLAVYPFWGVVAGQAGRLLRLQGRVAARQVQRRLKEQCGERETVSRAARRVLRSLVDWGVLEESSTAGVYLQGRSRPIDEPELIAWLTEAVLHTLPDGRGYLGAVMNSPSLFPFRLAPLSGDRLMTISNGLEVLRHGLDQELITLRPQGLSAAANRAASPRLDEHSSPIST